MNTAGRRSMLLPRLRLRPLGASGSGHSVVCSVYDLDVREPPYGHPPYEHAHHVHGVSESVVKPARKLVYVAVQVFGPDAVERSIVSAPEKDPERLYAVGADIASDVLAVAVVDRFVVLGV